MWPLGFCCPAPKRPRRAVAAMFVLMTKAACMRCCACAAAVFGSEAGDLTGFGFAALTLGGMATLMFGAIGMLASQDGGRMAGYGAVVSSARCSR